MPAKAKIVICGVLPPPYFGHSMLYEMLMRSTFVETFDVTFLNMHFWSYETNQKVTGGKLIKLVKYYAQYLWLITTRRPKYILYNSSFYKMPFLKDFLFCATGIALGRRVVIHDHGQYVRELHEVLPGWQKGMLCWMLRHVAASIVMGEAVKPCYKGLMPLEKLFVVPGAVEDSRSITAAPDRMVGAALNVLYFSYMSRSKGVEVAFDAAALVLSAERDVHFTFAGPLENDEITRGLEKLQAQFSGRVRYMGYVEDIVERTALFRGADVFFFPTLRDVFGLVLLHAMAEGVPIVASREGTIPEIVAEGENGFLCEKGRSEEFAAKLRQILNDGLLRRKIADTNRKRYEDKYTLARYGQTMVEAFESIGGQQTA